jgi:hypothetical protein
MTVEEFGQLVPGLAEKDHNEKIKLLGWYLHVHQGKSRFETTDVRKCYDALHMQTPASFSGYFENLSKPGKGLLKDKSGYRLEGGLRAELDKQYGTREITVQVTELLLKLPEKIPDLAERVYLDEALKCYKHDAPRAAIVMTWNLTYHHLCDYVLKNRLGDFNARWQVVFQGQHRRGTKTIVNMDDFGELLKESEVIEICNSASIITSNMFKILKPRLDGRNAAAHPSNVEIGQLQAEAYIDDLIKNVVLKLK